MAVRRGRGRGRLLHGNELRGEPGGVGRAVNRAIVVAFMLVFALNYVITTVYFVAFPPRI
ncbi:ABC transporter permease [Actinomadura chokoriensis]|uniref:ABC transporter permease n=1 Tax=Actinomadura chokoriensis TaxID=454156 RepID=A0ABV4QY38_9ACTN